MDFNAIVDHLALTHINKSNAEPTTTRIKRLLEVLIFFHFIYATQKERIWYLVTFYLGRNRTTVTQMRLYLFQLTCKVYYSLGSLDKVTS